MAHPPDTDGRYEVVCPHCKKSFEAYLLGGAAARQKGFKCPHCRLFVAYGRADEQEPAEREA